MPMDLSDQIDAFSDDLNRLIDRYRSEFDLTVPSVLGVLELAKLDIYRFDIVEAEGMEDQWPTDNNNQV